MLERSHAENVGKYLCKQYYTGALAPSSMQVFNSADYFLARCVEIPLEDSKGTRARLSSGWRQLMCGDCAKLNQGSRLGLLGGRADLDELSVDGGILCTNELVLYHEVGQQFSKLFKPVEQATEKKESVVKKKSFNIKLKDKSC